MGNFDVKVQRFLDIFIGNSAYLQVLEGLKKHFNHRSCRFTCWYPYRYSYRNCTCNSKIQSLTTYFKWNLLFLCRNLPWYTYRSTASYFLLRTLPSYGRTYNRTGSIDACIWS